jgi:tol-pal system protein YbgF
MTVMSAMLAASVALSQSACMKTRSQIKGSGDAEQGDSDDSAAKGGAPRGNRYEVEEIKSEVTRISGKLDEVEHQQRTTNYGELKEYTVRLDGRIAELEKNQLLVMGELKALKDNQAAAATAAREAAVPAGDLLNQGNKLLAQQNCQDAAEKFRALLNKNPKGKEAAEAHFGLGEAEYCDKDFKKAIVQYSKVQDMNPKSARVPASLYKIGLSFQHLNMQKEARNFFNELIEKYPKSAEAKKARSKSKE